LALIFAETDAGGELGFGVGINRHRFVLSGWKAPGGGQPGWT
jgi:hypothetical protein